MADRAPATNERLLLGGLVVLAVLGGVLWSGGALSTLVSRGTVSAHHPLAGFVALGHPSDPSRAWDTPVGPPAVYWTSVVTVCVVSVCLVFAGRSLVARLTDGPTRIGGDGFAHRSVIERSAGRRPLVRRAASLRPLLSNATSADLGFRLGHAQGHDCWASIEDSLVVLGPPRSGKGLHLVIPAILDSPGAVVTTSTRPDNLAATLAARRDRGPVAVFDPQGLADGVSALLRWSPVRGCVSPDVAMARARALCADRTDGVENGSFWAQQCYTVVRCLLHAAALSNSQPADLVRWSLSPLAAEDACEVLRRHPHAAPAWSTALEAILSADPRQRDSTWAMVSNTFGALADPRVLAAVSPAPGETFDPATFLAQNGTLYLLGTASGAAATASLVGALIEDIVETARRTAAASPGARLEPPLSVVLDEAANYPIPSLQALMSEGGGSGISTLVVLQSLAQARARWGQQEAAAIWDAANVKITLGGSANADDLRDLSALVGTRRETRMTHSRGADGRVGTSTSTNETPVLDAGDLRTLPFGTAVLLLRSAPPIKLRLCPWTRRADAATIIASRASIEDCLRTAARRRSAT